MATRCWARASCGAYIKTYFARCICNQGNNHANTAKENIQAKLITHRISLNKNIDSGKREVNMNLIR